jgi:hypothetical protein
MADVTGMLRTLAEKRHSPRVHDAVKTARGVWTPRPDDAGTLLIVGCQRSGTSLLLRLLGEDGRTIVFGEKSRLFSDAPGNRRMIDVERAVDVVASRRARLVVLKPLVESHRTTALLDAFPNAAAVWLYRDYRDVVRSNLRAFGDDNGSSDLAPILADDLDNWRALGVSAATRDRVRELAVDATEREAAALFWWTRNSILFDSELVGDPRVAICRYTTLVAEPVRVRDALYELAGQAAPTRPPREQVRTSSIGRGQEVELRPLILAACEEMLERLDRVATIR